jgi:hypothetical protein
MKNLARILSGILLLAAGLQAANPLTLCSASDMKGRFATMPVGFLLAVPPPLPAGPFTAAGILNFDGAGHFSGTASSSFSGFILNPFPATGNYSVTPGCVLSALETTLNLQFDGPFTRDKNEVVLFQTQQTTITSTVLHRQFITNCDARALSDNWVVQASGSVFSAPGSAETRFVQNGSLKFDGKSSFTGTTASSLGGQIVNHNITGQYTVNSDCTFAGSFTDEAGAVSSIFGALYDIGEEFYFDYSAPAPSPASATSLPAYTGWVVSGTGRQAVSSTIPGSQGTVSGAATLTASPNPITTSSFGVGTTTLTWNAPGTTKVEIHVGSPSGPIVVFDSSSGTVTTGAWVSDGTIFYLQDVSNGKAVTLQNTMATVVVAVPGQ